jgi:hypothetical protein
VNTSWNHHSCKASVAITLEGFCAVAVGTAWDTRTRLTECAGQDMASSGADVAEAMLTPARPTVVGIVGANGLFGKWLIGVFGAVCPDAEVLCVDVGATAEFKREFVAR